MENLIDNLIKRSVHKETIRVLKSLRSKSEANAKAAAYEIRLRIPSGGGSLEREMTAFLHEIETH